MLTEACLSRSGFSLIFERTSDALVRIFFGVECGLLFGFEIFLRVKSFAAASVRFTSERCWRALTDYGIEYMRCTRLSTSATPNGEFFHEADRSFSCAMRFAWSILAWTSISALVGSFGLYLLACRISNRVYICMRPSSSVNLETRSISTFRWLISALITFS